MNVYAVVYTNRYHEDGFEIGGVYLDEEHAEEAGQDREGSSKSVGEWDNYHVQEHEVRTRRDPERAFEELAEVADAEWAAEQVLARLDAAEDYDAVLKPALRGGCATCGGPFEIGAQYQGGSSVKLVINCPRCGWTASLEGSD